MTKILSTILLFAPLLVAQGPDVHFKTIHTTMGGHESLKSHLSLTDDQLQQLQNLRRDQFERMRPSIEQMAEKQRALDEALAAASPDPALVGRLTIELQQIRKEIPDSRETLREQALAILGADQRAKLDDLGEALQLHATATQAVGLNLLDPNFAAMPGGHEGVWIGNRTASLTDGVGIQANQSVYFIRGPEEPIQTGPDHVIIRKQRIQ